MCGEVHAENNQEDKNLKHPESHLKNDAQKRKVHSPFIIYVLCDQLKNDMGNAIVDTGSQVSLVIESNLARGSQIEKQIVAIHGIAVNVMETRGQVKLCIGETLPHEFLVVKRLPMDCEVLIGQDWLERFGYQFQIRELGITLPAYSETIVRIPTTEKGSRLVESQELQENVFCASSTVECADASFSSLIMNCNDTDQLLRKFPQT